jgi:hypothetical protein
VSLALIGFGREWSVAFRIKAILKNSEILKFCYERLERMLTITRRVIVICSFAKEFLR